MSRPVGGGLLLVVGASRQLGSQLIIGLLLAAVPGAMLDAELLVHAIDWVTVLVLHTTLADSAEVARLLIVDRAVGRLEVADLVLGGISLLFCRDF